MLKSRTVFWTGLRKPADGGRVQHNISFHKLPLLLMMMVIGAPGVSAQISTGSSTIPSTSSMVMQVKQLNQFVERFNYLKDPYDQPISTEFSLRVSRKQYIKYLFDLEDPRFKTETRSIMAKTEYAKKVDRFIDHVTEKDAEQYIVTDSCKIVAEALCEVLWNERLKEVTLILEQECFGDNIYKWVLAGVNTPDLVIGNEGDLRKYIPPVSNETNFIYLQRVFEDRYDLGSYAHTDFESDQLSIFLYLVSTGEISYHHVKTLRFHILDVPGWVMVVDEFTREGENSGWLISDLKEIGSEQGSYIMENLLHKN